jgi:very-short-patch-repair endonuclease
MGVDYVRAKLVGEEIFEIVRIWNDFLFLEDERLFFAVVGSLTEISYSM